MDSNGMYHQLYNNNNNTHKVVLQSHYCLASVIVRQTDKS